MYKNYTIDAELFVFI